MLIKSVAPEAPEIHEKKKEGKKNLEGRLVTSAFSQLLSSLRGFAVE